MRRIRIAGLCLVAMVAAGAFAASSAFGIAAEVGRCVKVTPGTGKYGTNPNCTEKKAKGEYEWQKNAIKKKFTSAGGEGVLETASGTTIKCSTQSAVGEYREKGLKPSTKEVQHVVATFKGCELPLLAAKCNTVGHPTGEIVTKELKGPLGYISGEGTKSPVVGQKLEPEAKKKPFAEFECAGGAVNVIVGVGKVKPTGNDCIIAPLSEVNVMSTTVKQTYSGSGGKQEPQFFQKTPTKICNLESNTNGGPYERATQALVTTVTNEEPLEVKA